MNANNIKLTGVIRKSLLLKAVAVVIVAALILLFLPQFSAEPYIIATSANTRNQINDMEQRLENNRAEQARVSAELARLLRATNENEALLIAIEQQINLKITEIFDSEELIQLHEQLMRENEAEIAQLEERREELRGNLAERLRNLHENGGQNILSIINDSSSFFELIIAIERSVTRVDRDRAMISELEEMQEQLDAIAEELEEQRLEQLRLRAYLEIQHDALQERQNELNDVLYQLNRDSEQNQVLSDQLAGNEEQYEQSMESLIQQLERQLAEEEARRRAEEERIRREQEAAATANRPAQNPPANTNTAPPPPVNPSDEMMWPTGFCSRDRRIATRITSQFGYRTIFGRRQFHTGIDVGAQFGTPIYAAQCGVVLISQFHHSWGNYIVISHGTDSQGRAIQTLYAHAQRLHVRPGQQVSRGQRIADVGSTGTSTGPHLHFEVRVNGRPVAPLPFVQASRNRVLAGQPA
ncbi:MAG: peptidoglycan DD-metalloendopeptidase family protein [Oscillospiraceae bacterium]|nr:peptidoglycan DD-metalloendopeptidase family protein [Oscillospiraceae bacterium]